MKRLLNKGLVKTFYLFLVLSGYNLYALYYIDHDRVYLFVIEHWFKCFNMQTTLVFLCKLNQKQVLVFFFKSSKIIKLVSGWKKREAQLHGYWIVTISKWKLLAVNCYYFQDWMEIVSKVGKYYLANE